jgi:hypothetical protein
VSAALAQAQQAEPLVSQVQYREGYYGGRRFVGPGGYYGRPYYGRYYRRDRGGDVAAGIAGLATGALIGGAIASQAQPVYPAYPAYGAPGGDAVGYCSQRYRSYDPASGTFLGYDGLRHPCP